MNEDRVQFLVMSCKSLRLCCKLIIKLNADIKWRPAAARSGILVNSKDSASNDQTLFSIYDIVIR